MTKVREFLSIEQALQQAIKDLRDDGLKQATGKSEAHFRKCLIFEPPAPQISMLMDYVLGSASDGAK